MRGRVLGFSGFDGSRDFKRRRLAGLTDQEYAVFQGADAAAALVADGQVVAAAAEERWDGLKHSERFPSGAADYCLRAGGLDPAALASGATDLLVAHSFDFAPERDFLVGQSDYYRELYDAVLDPAAVQEVAQRALGCDLTDRFVPVPHHLAHATGAYLPSGYRDALVVVSDGLGERWSATALAATPEGFETVCEIPAHDSLGLLYGLFTMYLGFRFGDGEYKVMGLAPHGDPERHLAVLTDQVLQLDTAGRYRTPILLSNVSTLDKETYRPALARLEELFGPRRAPGDPLDQRHKDIAASLQAALQAAQYHFLSHLRESTGLDRLCLSGGVALNCVANGTLLRSGLFSDIHVQPAAADDGAALGAALWAGWQRGERARPVRHTLLGPGYGPAECEAAAASVQGVTVTRFTDDKALTDHVAGLIDEGAVVGWFQGRMEFGPRALGNRSILADPRRPDMRARINALVKKRESFRPFAPAVTAEAAAELFEIDPEDVSRFAEMLFVCYVRPEHADRMPATTHVDGSARTQTVSSADNALFHQLIQAFEHRTGLPVLLNTSFNQANQPIVRTPQEAVDTFLAAGLDALVLGDLLLLPDGRPDAADASDAADAADAAAASAEGKAEERHADR
ncbi:putative carbamoyltransferase [Actinacidiphila reveromycinica]|uniref:Putative carbamoyltransferase n=1 Tax=Actinacidiphila reveromycinica TaxID=659352 RepID=A0A7U3V0E2_9ACTN|nr:carbamoyltransferase C-terminal domain-containing protein [Streptomyces sp. SN-593]BBB01929.1 putative carbamoyltransferase [Streptomyces sp. SN-593]